MNENIERISKELKGEMLICDDNRTSYDEYEKDLIISSIATRIAENPNYLALIPEHHQKLRKVAEYCVKNTEQCINAMEIIFKISKYEHMSEIEQGEENCYETYIANIRYGYHWQEPYSYVIAHRVIDIEQMKEIYDEGSAFNFYRNDTNFLITNNILLTRNPEFFDKNSLEQLEKIARYRDRKDYFSHKEYSMFKKAASVTLKNIKYNQKQKVKYKSKY